jgi:hypothetical protein
MSYLEQLIATSLALPRGNLYDAQVLHDAECPKLRGEECTCDADIEIVQSQIDE